MGPYLLCTILLLFGVYGVIAKKNLVKIVIGLTVIEYSVNLMLILIGYRSGGVAPIVTDVGNSATEAAGFVDPLPQALIVTSIVIGLGLTALIISLCLRLYEKYGTFDILQIRRLKG
ncbi:MAG: NADH-quinone oxidoreductase subunit K [Candidatus Latescibacteria bacterium]|nr:NADH-quinone oxidoreductase subunit K [Candidatus Latescibacterota bacterium]